MGRETEGAFTAEEILDALCPAVIVTDLDGTVVYWNPAAEELFGWTAEEALGRNINDLTVPQMARDDADDLMRSLVTGRPWSGGFPVRRKDGSIFPALVSDAGIRHDGNLVGIVGTSINVGAAIKPLLERSTDAAIVLRSDAMVTYASPAVAQLFGWEDSIVGTSIVPLLHPDERPLLAEFMEEVVAQPGAHPPLELRVLTEEGWVWCEAALTNLLDDPLVRGLVCNLRRSLRREAHEHAEIRAQQLDRALRSRITIEQAKGFLACRHEITPDEAFEHLRGYARSHQVSIQDASRQVLDGALDPLV
ncbi:MAG TPA: PAS domain S-box protein [Nocardioidaceae bacterium]